QRRKDQTRERTPTKNIRVDEIFVGPRMRELNPAKLDGFVVSLREVGLKTALTIRVSTEPSKTGSRPWILVAGAHRLEAARRLGWKTIRCEIFSGNADEARTWEIRENLDRAELNVLERAEHIVGLLELLDGPEVSAQVAPKPRGGRPASGIREAARALGLE